MTEGELDNIYTQICRTMTELGEDRAPLFLARLALLAIDAIDDTAAAERLIAEAGEGLGSAESAAAALEGRLG